MKYQTDIQFKTTAEMRKKLVRKARKMKISTAELIRMIIRKETFFWEE